MDMRLQRITYEKMTWDNFRSELSHYLKYCHKSAFLVAVKEYSIIETLWDRKAYAEAFYILALYDYFTDDKDNAYDFYRKNRLSDMLFPLEVEMMDRINKNDREKEKMLKVCKNRPLSQEFLKYNISEYISDKELKEWTN